MTDAIPSRGSSFQLPPQETPEEKKKIFEVQFETSLLGIFVAVSDQNNDPVQQQVTQIKKGISVGESSSQLAGAVNQLINQLNLTITTTPFPPFQFSAEGNQGISYQAITLEKCLLTLADKGHINPEKEHSLFDQLATFIGEIPHMNPADANQQLAAITSYANDVLPKDYKISNLRISH